MTLRKWCYLGLVLTIWGFSFRKPFDGSPEHFPAPKYQPELSAQLEAQKQLGRVLFYEEALSKDSTISCASCHSPYNAFAHTDHDLSHGIRDQIGKRNAPGLFNLAWQKNLMWDGAVHHLEMQALAPLTDASEMDNTLLEVVNRLNNSHLYPPLTAAAFGSSTITGEQVLEALAQFQASLVSANARYDKVKRGETTFSEQEARGYQVFQQHCNACHTEPLFTNFSFENNGLPVDTTLNDWGRYAVTQLPEDSLKFKVPSLRNLRYTFPYMHDGRFENLREVLRHYEKGMAFTASLSEQLREGVVINDVEKSDLLAFLLTLNDESFVFNPEHQYPKEIFNQSKD